MAAWLTPRAGRRAGGRKQGRAAAGTARRGRRLRAPPGAASADHATGTGGSGPTRSPKSPPPTRTRHRSPRPSAARGDGCGDSRRPSALRRGGPAARGRRQLTGGTAPQQPPPPPPEEPEPERAGPEAPLTRATAAAEARLPADAAPPAAGPSGFWRGARKNGVSSPPWPFFW